MTLAPTRRAILGLLCLSGLAAAGCGFDLGMGAEARETWTRTYTLSDRGIVSLKNTNGRVVVTTGDGHGVEVVAEKIGRAHSDEGARDALRRIEITDAASPDRIEIDSANKGLGLQLNSSTQVSYTIKMPSNAGLTLRLTNGDIDATGIGGPLDIKTTNGRVAGRALGGSVVVETVNGMVTLDLDAIGSAGLICDTTNGAVDVSVPAAAKAELALRVTNGVIDVSGLDLASSENSRRKVTGTIGGGGPLIRIETTNGRVRIRGR